MNLSGEVRVQRILAGAVAGTDLLTSDAIDMQGFDGVLIVGEIKTVNAGNYFKLQQSADDAAADAYSDIEGSKTTPTGTKLAAVIDLYRPLKRYVKALITRGASTVTGDVYAILYKGRKLPADQSDNVDNLLVSPAEGTA